MKWPQFDRHLLRFQQMLWERQQKAMSVRRHLWWHTAFPYPIPNGRGEYSPFPWQQCLLSLLLDIRSAFPFLMFKPTRKVFVGLPASGDIPSLIRKLLQWHLTRRDINPKKGLTPHEKDSTSVIAINKPDPLKLFLRAEIASSDWLV